MNHCNKAPLSFRHDEAMVGPSENHDLELNVTPRYQATLDIYTKRMLQCSANGHVLELHSYFVATL